MEDVVSLDTIDGEATTKEEKALTKMHAHIAAIVLLVALVMQVRVLSSRFTCAMCVLDDARAGVLLLLKKVPMSHL